MNSGSARREKREARERANGIAPDVRTDRDDEENCEKEEEGSDSEWRGGEQRQEKQRQAEDRKQAAD